jgi:hypothetical protein
MTMCLHDGRACLATDVVEWLYTAVARWMTFEGNRIRPLARLASVCEVMVEGLRDRPHSPLGTFG